MDPVTVLIQIVVVVVILGLIWWALGLLPLDARIKQVIMVLLALIAVLFLLRLLGVWA